MFPILKYCRFSSFHRVGTSWPWMENMDQNASPDENHECWKMSSVNCSSLTVIIKFFLVAVLFETIFPFSASRQAGDKDEGNMCGGSHTTAL